VDTLLIATTSRTTTSAPITVQIHIPPPIHPYAWFIVDPNSRPKLQSSLDLAAAIVIALRSSRRLAQILLRTKVEFLLALGSAEVIGLPFVLSSSNSSSAFYIHATDRIFHSCCAIHFMTFLRFRNEVSNRRAASSEQECSLWPDQSVVPSTFDEYLRTTQQCSVSG
jgi:hypothetical protein